MVFVVLCGKSYWLVGAADARSGGDREVIRGGQGEGDVNDLSRFLLRSQDGVV